MQISEYQKAAKKTAIYPYEYEVTYPILGLCAEAGELANKYKKVLRGDAGQLTDEKAEELANELGDVLWYVAAIANDLGFSLDQIAEKNVQKLKSRQTRGVLAGSGDNR